MSKYREIGEKVIALTEEKDAAYGHAVATAGDVLKLLYPDGVKPEQYRDAAIMVRVIDKLKRIATKKNAFGESPWLDIMGYGLAAEVAETTADVEATLPQAKATDKYQFPPIIFVGGNDLKLQSDHVFSEALEVTDAYDAGDHGHAVEELWDLIHSAETMIRMYQAAGHDVWAAKYAVGEKNRQRGYYNGR